MSVFCQFCDKKMMFEEQATIVEDYITCGKSSCQLKAKGNAKEFKAEQLAHTAEKVKVCVFATLDFEDESSWRLIHKVQHPSFLENPHMMTHLLVGGVITV